MAGRSIAGDMALSTSHGCPAAAAGDIILVPVPLKACPELSGRRLGRGASSCLTECSV